LGRDQGATFTVELPSSRLAESPRGDPITAKTSASRPTGEHLQVLLVEDHDASRQVLARLLAARHIGSIEASSAAEAIDKARAHRFDLVISDIGLPDSNGYDLMAALSASYGCKGIALSGYGTERDIARSKAAGFLVHLTKPVQAQALHEALDQFVKA
jgi:CheY-like chemotaxis protein